MTSENIFSALAKYNSAVDENYLTESFVFVINALLQQERPIGIEILNRLCVENSEFSFDIGEDISVSTQEVTEQGTPDIKVSSPNKLIYIEVKHDSELGYQQIERYKKALESSVASIKHVVLLTRFAVEFDAEQDRPYKHVRWSDVHNWLANAKPQDLVAAYLIKQFKSFLEVKGMSIEKVGWEYINGVPAFNNLIDMIEAAIEAAKIHFYPGNPRAAAWDWKAFYLENKNFWCGIRYDNHLVIVFQMEDKKNFDKKLINTPSYPIDENRDYIWFELQLEKIHFFSLDKDAQLEEITKFVKTAYKEAQQMRIKDQ